MYKRQGVDTGILDPRDTYADASEWEAKAKDLAETMDAAGYQFSSANSINIGRLVPPVSYTHLDVYKRQGIPCKYRLERNRKENHNQGYKRNHRRYPFW